MFYIKNVPVQSAHMQSPKKIYLSNFMSFSLILLKIKVLKEDKIFTSSQESHYFCQNPPKLLKNKKI